MDFKRLIRHPKPSHTRGDRLVHLLFREARSKTRYLGRLIHRPRDTLITKIFRHLRYTRLKTNWIKKINQIDRIYSIGTNRHFAKNENEWNKIVAKELNSIEEEKWISEVAKKKSLSTYAQHKKSPAPEPFYQGDRASGLLFQARSGSLLTRLRLSQLFGKESPACILCDTHEEEDINHILRTCPALHKAPSPKDITTILGFETPDDDDHNIMDTKRLLLTWEKATHQKLLERSETETRTGNEGRQKGACASTSW